MKLAFNISLKISLLLWANILVAADSVVEGHSYTLFEVEDAQLQSAQLFYRLKGSKGYMQQPLIQRYNQWSITFSGGQLRAPGLEYYVVLNYQNGDSQTEPKQYPKYNPTQLDVTPRAIVSIDFPDEIFATDNNIAFTVKGYVNAETRLFIGDMDVSDLVIRRDGEWLLENNAMLFADSQQLRIIDGSGQLLASQAINFTQPSSNTPIEGKNRELILRGSIGFNIGGKADTTPDSDRAFTLSGNLHLESEYQQGEFSSHYSGINVNYTHDAEERYQLSSGFLWRNSYKNSSLEVGDVSVSGTPLVLAGFSRRGLLVSSSGEDWSGSVFNVRTSTVDGWDSGISFDNRQSYGLSYEYQLSDDQKTNIQLSMISGELQTAQSESVASTDNSAQAGDSVGVLLSTELAGAQLSVQAAASAFDENTADAEQAEKDIAYEVSLSRDVFGLDSSLGFHHYGANYATISNPNFSGDRQGAELSIGSSWQFLQWSTSLSTVEDNLERDASRAIVTSNNSGASFGFIIEKWPSINLGFNYSQQSSVQAAGIEGVDNTSQNISLGLSDSLGAFDLAWNSSKGELSNNLLAGSDSETANHSFTLSFAGEMASFNLNLSQNRNQSDIELTSELINLSMDFPLFTESLILSTQFSFQKNQADDNSQNNQITGGNARIAWTVGEMFGTRDAYWSSAKFGLSWRYSNVTDELDSSQNHLDNVVLLDFSFGVPTSFENRWQF